MTDGPVEPAGRPAAPTSRRAAREAARSTQGGAAWPHNDLGVDTGALPARPDRAARPDRDDAAGADGRWRRRRGWLVPISAALLVAWAATCFSTAAGLLGVVPVTLATLAPFVSVAAVPVATVALRRRRWVSAAAALVAAVVPWTFVLGYASADPGPTQEGTRLTVLVVNAHDGRADAADIVSAVRGHDVDLLVVTELSRTLSHELTASQLGSYLAPQWFDISDEPEAGLGIWSELDVGSQALLEGTTWPAVRATVQTRAGEVTLVAGHAVPPVPNDADAWAGDLRAFAASTRGTERVLLVGSFNASPWHAQYRALLGDTLVDAADVRGRGLRPTWPTWTPLPLVPMDAALVTRDLRVVSADTVAIDDTDHRALLVALEVPGELLPGR
ncbi:MAG: endonuclease/exonuclease/phosphatase family protein [Kineosporiaceae bacterium]